MTRTTRKKPRVQDADGWADPSGTELERKLFQVLHESYLRADAAAKATARLEYVLAKDLNQQTDDGDEEDLSAEAAMREVGSDFDHSLFDTVFTNLNLLRLLQDLLPLLGLEAVKDDLLKIVLDDRFRSRPKLPRTVPAQSVIGSDSDMLLHNIRRAVEQQAKVARATNGMKV